MARANAGSVGAVAVAGNVVGVIVAIGVADAVGLAVAEAVGLAVTEAVGLAVAVAAVEGVGLIVGVAVAPPQGWVVATTRPLGADVPAPFTARTKNAEREARAYF